MATVLNVLGPFGPQQLGPRFLRHFPLSLYPRDESITIVPRILKRISTQDRRNLENGRASEGR